MDLSTNPWLSYSGLMRNSVSDESVVRRLHCLLRDIRNESGDSFSGIGVIVAVMPEKLPIFPLRANAIVHKTGSTAAFLASISQENNSFHDGFHVLSLDMEVNLTSMYFSPPIIPETKIEPRRGVGGRYMAALFGSSLPGVAATGIAGKGSGVAVFESGKEVSSEP